MKRVTARLAMHFVCSNCKGIMEGTVDSIKKLCDEVEIGNGFCYLGDRLNSSGGCEAAVTARVRIGWEDSGNVESYCLEIGFLCG